MQFFQLTNGRIGLSQYTAGMARQTIARLGGKSALAYSAEQGSPISVSRCLMLNDNELCVIND
jgi:hypothetical protein